MMKNGKVDKSNTYNMFTDNISFVIHRTCPDQTYLEFLYILAIEEINKIKEKN